MIQELLKAFMLIFVAEMGDKTQILAMAFATRFPVKKVLLGIFIGSFLNHGLAVLLGSYISNFIPINTIQIVAGFAFVGFALWTLKAEDDEEEEDKQKTKFGPVLTVALAFFIGELGDKTQLTAITLATDAVYPFVILGGTVLGMIVTGGIGIIIGKQLGDKIPEFAIKIIAATVFMFFGVTKLYQTVPREYLSTQNIAVFAGIIAIAVFLLLRPTIIKRRENRESALIKKSRELYNYYHQVGENMGKVCLGEVNCGECQGDRCIVGQTKTLIKNGESEDIRLQNKHFTDIRTVQGKSFDKKKVLESLKMTLEVIKSDPDSEKYSNINSIRRNLEMILFGRSLDQIKDWEQYTRFLEEMDKDIAVSLLKE